MEHFFDGPFRAALSPSGTQDAIHEAGARVEQVLRDPAGFPMWVRHPDERVSVLAWRYSGRLKELDLGKSFAAAKSTATSVLNRSLEHCRAEGAARATGKRSGPWWTPAVAYAMLEDGSTLWNVSRLEPAEKDHIKAFAIRMAEFVRAAPPSWVKYLSTGDPLLWNHSLWKATISRELPFGSERVLKWLFAKSSADALALIERNLMGTSAVLTVLASADPPLDPQALHGALEILLRQGVRVNTEDKKTWRTVVSKRYLRGHTGRIGEPETSRLLVDLLGNDGTSLGAWVQYNLQHPGTLMVGRARRAGAAAFLFDQTPIRHQINDQGPVEWARRMSSIIQHAPTALGWAQALTLVVGEASADKGAQAYEYNERERYTHAVCLLEEMLRMGPRTTDQLKPTMFRGLLTHEDRDIRTRVIALLGRMNPANPESSAASLTTQSTMRR